MIFTRLGYDGLTNLTYVTLGYNNKKWKKDCGKATLG